MNPAWWKKHLRLFSPAFTCIRVFNGWHFYIARSSVKSLFIISARVSLLSRQLKAFPRVSPKRSESIKFLNFRLCYIVAYAIKVTNVAQYVLVTLFAFNNRSQTGEKVARNTVELFIERVKRHLNFNILHATVVLYLNKNSVSIGCIFRCSNLPELSIGFQIVARVSRICQPVENAFRPVARENTLQIVELTLLPSPSLMYWWLCLGLWTTQKPIKRRTFRRVLHVTRQTVFLSSFPSSRPRLNP